MTTSTEIAQGTSVGEVDGDTLYAINERRYEGRWRIVYVQGLAHVSAGRGNAGCVDGTRKASR